MGLNKTNGNMYEWATHTWNTIKGQCYHDCSYCYMKRWGKLPVIHFDEKELQTDLGQDNTIFVGSSNDMFADEIPEEWIQKTIRHIYKYSNSYVFQSKNLKRIYDWCGDLPIISRIGTTIETNRDYCLISKASCPTERIIWFKKLIKDYELMIYFITIEPIMDFDLEPFAKMIINAKPSFVNIGADSKRCNLPEPGWGKVSALIQKIQEAGIEIRQKSNLKRLKEKQ